MRRILITCACLAALASSQASAQSSGVYKWKDAKGVTHYSDRPPPGQAYDSVEANAAARVKAPAKEDPRCTTARQNLERLKSGGADIGLDADGDGKPDGPLTAEQRAQQQTKAEIVARSFCTPTSP